MPTEEESVQNKQTTPAFNNGCFYLLFVPLSIVAVVFGGWLIYLAGNVVSSCVHGHLSRNWPTVNGKVVDSGVESSVETGTHGVLHTSCRPMIKYEYEVSGVSHAGNNWAFHTLWSTDTAWAESIIQKYPTGSQVTVYYDPANPDRSVLEPGVQWRIESWAAAMCLLYAVIVCVAFRVFYIFIRPLQTGAA